MSTVASCIISHIEKYIQDKYSGGLIGISDLAKYCNEIEGKVYVALLELEKLNFINWAILLSRRMSIKNYIYQFGSEWDARNTKNGVDGATN
jgi:hypothetical protein